MSIYLLRSPNNQYSNAREPKVERQRFGHENVDGWENQGWETEQVTPLWNPSRGLGGGGRGRQSLGNRGNGVRWDALNERILWKIYTRMLCDLPLCAVLVSIRSFLRDVFAYLENRYDDVLFCECCLLIFEADIFYVFNIVFFFWKKMWNI